MGLKSTLRLMRTLGSSLVSLAQFSWSLLSNALGGVGLHHQHPCWTFLTNLVLDFPCQPPVGLSTSLHHSAIIVLGLEIICSTVTPTWSWERQTKYSSPLQAGLTHRVIMFLEGKAPYHKTTSILGSQPSPLIRCPFLEKSLHFRETTHPNHDTTPGHERDNPSSFSLSRIHS